MTKHKASEIAAALERCAKELHRIPGEIPMGTEAGGSRDLRVSVGIVSANARHWSRVFWQIAGDKLP